MPAAPGSGGGLANNRVVIVAVVFTLIATFYSLSELHRLSTLHASNDSSKFAAQADGSGATRVTERKAQGSDTTSTSVSQTQSSNVATTTAVTAVASPALVMQPAKQVAANVTPGEKKCYTYEHTELWGEVVVWGTEFKTTTAAECCDACRNYKPKTADDYTCNVWVWCGTSEGCMKQVNQCWLKHLAHPEASKPAHEGANVPWTSGTVDVDLLADPVTQPKLKGPPRKFHIVTSAQGTAVHWQVRVHYYWINRMKVICQKAGDCEMGGFTRLLHSGQPDDLMDELPTVVVDPLPSSMVEHSWYIVLNRPYAFVQWTQKVKIPERYVLMSEPDHIFLRPMPNFMNGDVPAAFPFFYIEPAKAENAKITQKFTGPISKAELEQIAPIGNSPTFMTWDDMVKVMPIWMNTSIAVFKDTEASSVWGWVQEMYGFTIAVWLSGIKKVDLFLHLMAQPPWDSSMNLTPNKPFYILHYTYGMDFKLTGEFTPGKFGEWRFDKRTYSGRPPPRHLGDPPKDMKNDLVRKLINSFNEAFEALGCWDEYQASGKITPCTTGTAAAVAASVAEAGNPVAGAMVKV